MTGRVHSIETFGTVDGPGIRYVVFLQGCPMRCRYCHNPDTWAFDGGREMTAEEITADCESCREFLKSGGITVTGGEPLMQMDFVREIFTLAHERGIHTCLDTSGVTFSEKRIAEFERLMAVTDLGMLDIKHIDSTEHKKLTDFPNENILAFAKWLTSIDKPVWIRHVVVPGITMNEEYLDKLGRFLGDMTNLKALDVLPYHDMGREKYKSMGMEYPLEGVQPLDKEKAKKARDIIMSGVKARLHEKKRDR